MGLYLVRVTILIIHIRGLITPLITTHEPPSRTTSGGLEGLGLGAEGSGLRGLEGLEGLEG